MKTFRRFFTVLTVCICVGVIFVGTGYLYLDKELEPAENKVSSVPYSPDVPENAGVMFKIGDKAVLCYLDFEYKSLSVVFDSFETKIGDQLYGYSVDYVVEGNLGLLEGIVDNISGIELATETETFRFTGVQISELVAEKMEEKDFLCEIILKICEKIEKTGFQNTDFLYIIENSETNLTVPDCYYWQDYISALCANVRIVN